MKRDGFIAGVLLALAGLVGYVGYRNQVEAELASLRAYGGGGVESAAQPIEETMAEPRLATAVTSFEDPGVMAPVLRQIPAILTGLNEEDHGFLGSRSALTQDGMTYLALAWFRDVRALTRWYEDRLRPSLLKTQFPQLAAEKPRFVGPYDPKAPVMAMLTFTPDGAADGKEHRLALTQMSIEVYSAAAAPMSIGSTFAPQKAIPKGLVAAVSAKPRPIQSKLPVPDRPTRLWTPAKVD